MEGKMRTCSIRKEQRVHVFERHTASCIPIINTFMANHDDGTAMTASMQNTEEDGHLIHGFR